MQRIAITVPVGEQRETEAPPQEGGGERRKKVKRVAAVPSQGGGAELCEEVKREAAAQSPGGGVEQCEVMKRQAFSSWRGGRRLQRTGDLKEATEVPQGVPGQVDQGPRRSRRSQGKKADLTGL